MKKLLFVLTTVFASATLFGACASGTDDEPTTGAGGSGKGGSSGFGGIAGSGGSGWSGAGAGASGGHAGAQGGSGGKAGAAGSAGSGGTAGTGGVGGSGGGGGTAGGGGSAGSATGGSGGSTGGSAGSAGSATGGSGGGSTGYSHTIAIDGTNDFAADDTFPTTTASFSAYISWDATNLYVGMKGSDISQGSGTRWVLVYLGGSDGSDTGQAYGTQVPALPFEAKYHLRWKADNTYTGWMVNTGGTWTIAPFTGAAFRSNDFVELSVPKSSIGSPSTIQVHMSMINEQTGGEWTWAGVPNTTFTDGEDPAYTKYFNFDFSASTKPNAYAPQ